MKDKNLPQGSAIGRVFREFHRNGVYYLMALPAMLFVFFLKYLPMPGLAIAFKNYNFRKGIWGSPWAGFDNFRFFFTSEYAFRTTLNTIWINLNYLFWGTLLSVTFAIILNEVTHKKAVKVYQNIMFLPYFFSAIIIGKIVTDILFSMNAGLVNQITGLFGFEKVNWLRTPAPWVKIVVSAHVWNTVGYSVIIYLATITGIDAEMYEAASLDGAGKLQKIWHLTLPMLIPAIILMSLLSIGNMMFGDFAMIYAIIGEDNMAILPKIDIIETYIFRAVRRTADFSTSSAIGLFQAIVGFVLVFGSNALVKRFDKDYGLF
jgi:putative aldouronate transport system permease protein